MAVARLMGHSSTRMVELVYGQLTDATYRDAIARMPGGSNCNAGVTDAVQNPGKDGTYGTVKTEPSAGNLVPRAGIEPATRGFSVPVPNDLNAGTPKRKLRLVK